MNSQLLDRCYFTKLGMSRDWNDGYDFCDGSAHGDDGSDFGKQGNLVNIRSETEKDEGKVYQSINE